MDDARSEDQIPVYQAILYPHRSLGRIGFYALMAVLGGYTCFASLYFYHVGAWPVIGFFGVEILILWLAFRANYQSARGYEMITLTPEALVVTEHHPRRGKTEWTFHPHWAQVVFEQKGESESHLKVLSHGKGVEIGTFMTADEKKECAEALRAALRVFKTSKG